MYTTEFKEENVLVCHKVSEIDGVKFLVSVFIADNPLQEFLAGNISVFPSVTKKKELREKIKKIIEEPHYVGKNGVVLKGPRYEYFEKLWSAFNYKHGKAEAAEVWSKMELSKSIAEKIIKSAKMEAAGRQQSIDSGKTPIYLQGWLSAKRWEDYE